MKKTNQILVVPIGVAGSGKTTYVKKHYPQFQRISMDEIRGWLSLDPADPLQSQLAYRYCLPILRKALSNGKSAVWDATSLTPVSRKTVVDIAREFDARITMLLFDVPIDELLRRNSNRRGKVPDEVILSQLRELEPPSENEADKIIVVK